MPQHFSFFRLSKLVEMPRYVPFLCLLKLVEMPHHVSFVHLSKLVEIITCSQLTKSLTELTFFSL